MKTSISKFLKKLASLLGEERLIYNIMSEENKAIYNLKHYGYLNEIGWVKSLQENKSLDGNGEPIPWNSYPFIDFILPRLNKQMDVFEYGCGSSTLFYSRYVGKITSIETDKNWYEKIKKISSPNSTIYYESLEDGFEKYVNTVKGSGVKYDIISVDAFHRSECTIASMEALNEEGVLVLDDTDYDFYDNVLGKLKDAGFRRIDFWGMSPLVKYKKCTSVFYRTNNILNI